MDIKCFHRGEPGHIRRDCVKFKREQMKGKDEERQEEKDTLQQLHLMVM